MKDKILFLDSKTTPRTFNALEAKLGTKTKIKRYNKVATEETTSRLKKSKKQTESKRWVASQQALFFNAFYLGPVISMMLP